MAWKLLHVIGKGGSSTVYKAELDDGQGVVAIKQIDTDTMNKVQIDLITAEVGMMRALSHPNITSYLDTVITSKRIFILMEYAYHGSLRQFYQRQGALQESEVLYCLQDILAGLAYLHDKGFAHRDIKAANCLLFPQQRVKLADFGASKRYESESIVSGLKGTPNWMAPEVTRPGPVAPCPCPCPCGRVPNVFRLLSYSHYTVGLSEYVCAGHFPRNNTTHLPLSPSPFPLPSHLANRLAADR